MASSSVIIEFAKIFLGVLVLVVLLLLEQRPTFGVVSSVLFCHRMRGFVVDRHPSAAAAGGRRGAPPRPARYAHHPRRPGPRARRGDRPLDREHSGARTTRTWRRACFTQARFGYAGPLCSIMREVYDYFYVRGRNAQRPAA